LPKRQEGTSGKDEAPAMHWEGSHLVTRPLHRIANAGARVDGKKGERSGGRANWAVLRFKTPEEA